MAATEMIIVRGAGDIATGTICRLHRCGFKVLVLEKAKPTAIRRTVSLSEAVYSGRQTVEDVTAERIRRHADMHEVWRQDRVPLLVDPQAECLQEVTPMALVDAILAKKNCGTVKSMCDITIALGPGFFAGDDVHAVIETARGHNLGRVILAGAAFPDTGIPGNVGGITRERVLYAPCSGVLSSAAEIGSRVEKGDVLAYIDSTVILAPIPGVVRGMIRNRFPVHQGLKIADIDPRLQEWENCYTISDKARCISGGVVEAFFYLLQKSRARSGSY